MAEQRVEVKEDEEQGVKFQEITELLVAAGYFRARIKGLAPFDKVGFLLLLLLLLLSPAAPALAPPPCCSCSCSYPLLLLLPPPAAR